MSYYCPVCGRPTEYRKELHGLCPTCYTKLYGRRVESLDEKVRVNITFCPLCGRIYSGRSWIKPTSDKLSDLITRQIKKHKRLKDYIIKIDFDMEKFYELIENNEIEEEVGLYKSNLLVNKIMIKIRITKKICPLCMKKQSGSYYEYIIHIRLKNKNKRQIKELINLVNSTVHAANTYETVNIRRISDGLDIKISSFRLGEQIVKLLSQRTTNIREYFEKVYDKTLQKQITVKKVFIEI